MSRKGNPEAFPREEGPYSIPGMTLREWFAGQALIGILGCVEDSAEGLASRAWSMAEAMMAEREKRSPGAAT